jgi:hypothetical protein
MAGSGKDTPYDQLAKTVFIYTMVGAAIAISVAFVWTMLLK